MKKMIEYLREFDKKRMWNHYDEAKTREEKLELLQKQIVSLLGEFGEFANLVKKYRRDGTWYPEKLKEEVTDMFIFLLKISQTLEMDLEEEFYKKMKINEERFKDFVKGV